MPLLATHASPYQEGLCALRRPALWQRCAYVIETRRSAPPKVFTPPHVVVVRRRAEYIVVLGVPCSQQPRIRYVLPVSPISAPPPPEADNFEPTSAELRAAYADAIAEKHGPNAPLMTRAMREKREAALGKTKKQYDSVCMAYGLL